MKIAAGWLALLGFLLLLVAHGAAALGVDVQDHGPMIWLLVVGSFVVFLPAVIAASRASRARGRFFLLRGLPVWARAVTISLGVYLFLNFIPYWLADEGSARMEGDRYVLRHKRELVRELTAAEYHSRRAREFQVMSGHFLFLYFISFAMLVLHREKRVTESLLRGS